MKKLLLLFMFLNIFVSEIKPVHKIVPITGITVGSFATLLSLLGFFASLHKEEFNVAQQRNIITKDYKGSAIFLADASIIAYTTYVLTALFNKEKNIAFCKKHAQIALILSFFATCYWIKEIYSDSEWNKTLSYLELTIHGFLNFLLYKFVKI